jgi:hypothetical protein
MDYVSLFAAMNFFERLWDANLWYAVPLIVATSLVYAATRHEEMREILSHAFWFGLKVSGGMAFLFVLLWFFSRNL